MKVGDIVEHQGKVGIIVKIKKFGDNPILVDFAMCGWRKGHDGNSETIKLPSPSGWWHRENELTIVNANVYENLIIE